jgi:branched-chain amino acid transport system permease protein
MDTYAQLVVLGLGLGAIYVGVSTGLLLTYRATGIVNFAQAAIGAWGAYVYAELRKSGTLMLPVGSVTVTDGPADVWLSLILGLVMAAIVGALSYLLVFRPVRHAPELAQVVISVALLLVLNSWEILRFTAKQVPVAPVFPAGTVTIGGVTVPTRELWMAAVMTVLAIGVWAYLRFARVGVATRAAAENERTVLLFGYSPHPLAIIAMSMGAALSALGIIFGTSSTGLSTLNTTAFIVPAAAVLLLARMQSVGTVVVGGFALGVFQALLNLWSTQPWWPEWARTGFDYVIFFFVVIVILLVNARRLPARGSLQTIRLPDVRLPKITLPRAAVFVVVAVAALALTGGVFRAGITNTLIMMILALSFVVLVGYLGQVSLAQAAFAGAAGFILSRITMTWDLPFPLPLLIAALAAAALGALVALPAIRIRGSQLAIVTLAAAVAIERFVFGNYSLTPVEGNLVSPPTLFGLDLAPYRVTDQNRLAFSLLVLVILLVVILIFVRVARGNTGRAFLAVRANERAAASSGVSVTTAKLLGFMLSAFLAGVAGTLIGYNQLQISAASFGVMVGLSLLAIAYLGGITSISGALIAGIMAPSGIFYVVTVELFDIGDWYQLATGILLIITAILNPQGIAGALSQFGRGVRSRMAARRVGGADAAPPGAPDVADAAPVASGERR